MKKSLGVLVALFLVAAVGDGVAGPKPQPGTIISNTSVSCGTKKSKKQELDLMCQQYVVRSGSTDYTIRQPKPEEQHLIPLNTAIQFNLDKNKMKFKVDGTSFQFVVLSQAAAPTADAAATATPK